MQDKEPITGRRSVSFRIRDSYYKTFKACCKLTGSSPGRIIESFMYSYARQVSEVLESDKQDREVFKKIAEEFGDERWAKATKKEKQEFFKKFDFLIEEVDGSLFKETAKDVMTEIEDINKVDEEGIIG